VIKFGCISLGAVIAVVLAFVGLVMLGRCLPDAPGSPPVTVHAGASAPLGPLAPPAPLAVPVAGVARESLRDNWGDPRENGLREHHGTDIMAASGTPVIAAAPGIVEKLFESAEGGTTIYVRSPDRRWIYYYAHLAGYAPGLHEGQVVKTGEPLGFVGDTGNAGAGNYHLHFGLARTTPEQHWYQAQDVNPLPYLAGKAAYR
jgi:murein DD-endopeptidase MepM/ murein hydrolase activator NlpD